MCFDFVSDAESPRGHLVLPSYTYSGDNHDIVGDRSFVTRAARDKLCMCFLVTCVKSRRGHLVLLSFALVLIHIFETHDDIPTRNHVLPATNHVYVALSIMLNCCGYRIYSGHFPCTKTLLIVAGKFTERYRSEHP